MKLFTILVFTFFVLNAPNSLCQSVDENQVISWILEQKQWKVKRNILTGSEPQPDSVYIFKSLVEQIEAIMEGGEFQNVAWRKISDRNREILITIFHDGPRNGITYKCKSASVRKVELEDNNPRRPMYLKTLVLEK